MLSAFLPHDDRRHTGGEARLASPPSAASACGGSTSYASTSCARTRPSAAPLLRSLGVLAERLDEILGRLGLRGHRDRDLLALSLRLDHLEHPLPVRVPVPLRLPRPREAVDQVGGHPELLLADRAVPRINLVDRPDLVREVHLLERDHALAHAQAAEMLAVPHDVPRDAGETRLLHRPA